MASLRITTITSEWRVSSLLARFPPSFSARRSTPLRPFLSQRNRSSLSLLFILLTSVLLIFELYEEVPLGIDPAMEETYASQSKLLKEFTSIASIDKAWTFKRDSGIASCAFAFLLNVQQKIVLSIIIIILLRKRLPGNVSISQTNLLANKRRKQILSAHISKESDHSVNFQWAPFPIEMMGVSTMVPSPSVRKGVQCPSSVHGSVYTDGWFEGISWNSDETLIAYVAEEPSPSKPTFGGSGYKKGDSADKESGSWKGLGEWEEHWGETYAGKRQPALFVINIESGEVHAVEGISKSLSIGQVIWAPLAEGFSQYLVFVGWSSETRKLGIKYCYNRPCALYAVRAPFCESKANELQSKSNVNEDSTVVNLTQSISSAFFPRFSPDGKFLVFLSAKSSVDSGAHSATDSLHRIAWPTDGKPCPSANIVDVIPVMMCAEDGYFPGLYCSSILSNPWLSDGCTMILSSAWHSTQVILSVDVLSGNVSHVSPNDSGFSWNVLTLDGDNIVAVCSSPIDIPEMKYGWLAEKTTASDSWSWLDVSNPIPRCSEKIRSLLSSLQFSIMKIPVKDVSDCLTKGCKLAFSGPRSFNPASTVCSRKPFEAIFVSSNKKNDTCDPLIVVLHGGPHSVSSSSFSKNLAFLSSLGYSLLIVNYRGSLGFGEEALQSLPGKIGSQDVNDVLTAIDHVIDMGLCDPSKIAVVGGSHGGFLTSHLIGQAPDKFAVAAVRNPVCNLALMVGTTDIPDWCFVEAYGSQGKNSFTEAPSAEQLTLLHSKSPVSHIHKDPEPNYNC
ncbi:Acylamino-acid-releasing enzyme 1 [Vitis vinifera]|uniref:acylaminoacyl-peptidase n=1 Tax=Vitis vinifera TaxID=29760 RepID=A0A438KLW5_VITVI|nr:Acylamino-acid-releasing enzyme 1 [Vitis vinifera]